MIYSQIRQKVNESDPKWRFGYYGEKPHATFNEIINDSFDTVKKSSNYAGHCKYDDMYNPSLGGLRKSRTYSALAPTNGMSWLDRHIVGPDLRPYNAYKPKQDEWRQIKRKSQTVERVPNPLQIPEAANIPLPLVYRRRFVVPTSCTRHENFARYWGGRARGLDYCHPFLYSPEDNYYIEEDRRYQKLPYASDLIPNQLSARHSRQLLSLPYVTVLN